MERVFLGALRVDPSTGSFEGERSGVLSDRERRLFAALAAERGAIVTPAALAQAVWGEPGASRSRIKVLMGRLRRKLEEDPAQPRWILTHLRQGYSLATDDVATPPTEAPTPARPVTSADPIERPDLVGRDELIEELSTWALRRHGSWLTLTGVGGVGKSALLHWVHADLVERALPVYYVLLSEVTGTEAVLQRIAAVAGVKLPPGTPPQALLASALRARSGVWLLDDLDSLDSAAAEALDALFGELPGCRVLATRRQPLGHVEEAVLPVPPLGTSHAATLLRRLRPDAQDDELGATLGLPLAIRLQALTGVSGRLGAESQIEAALAVVVDSERVSLLAWHPPQAPPRVVQRLLGVSAASLHAWVGTGLVERLAGGDIRVHPAIRAALDRRLRRSDPSGHQRLAQREALLAYVAAHTADLFGLAPQRIRQELLAYQDHLIAWAESLRPESMPRWFSLADALLRSARGSGRERSWFDALTRLIRRLERRGLRVEAARLQLWLLRLVEPLWSQQQELEAALAVDREALPSEERDTLDLVLALCRLRERDLAAGAALLDALDPEQLSGRQRVDYMRRRADLEWLAGRPKAAMPLAEAAVDQARALGDAMLTCNAMGTFATTAQEAGDLERTDELLDQVEKAAISWDDRHRVARALRQRAQQAVQRRDASAALDLAARALALHHPGSAEYTLALYVHAVASRLCDRFAESLELLERALVACREDGIGHLVPNILDSQANVLVLQGALHEALGRYDQAREAALARGDARNATRVDGNIALVRFVLGEVEAAREALQLRAHVKLPEVWQGTRLWQRALIGWELGDRRRALHDLEGALGLARQLGSRQLAAACTLTLATWMLARGRAEEAAQWMETLELSADDVLLRRLLPDALIGRLARAPEPDPVRLASRVLTRLNDAALIDELAPAGAGQQAPG